MREKEFFKGGLFSFKTIISKFLFGLGFEIKRKIKIKKKKLILFLHNIREIFCFLKG